MDIMTGAGLLAGVIVIATMMLLGGDIHMFISEHAMIIIFGGSIAATMIRFPLGVMLHGALDDEPVVVVHQLTFAHRPVLAPPVRLGEIELHRG